MSSSNQFPSGLNNWAASDKPTRMDFVQDNEILDENAMWKQAYDPDGEVAGAGGVAAFALDKESYDADGTVAQLGGIMAAVATNEGFAAYAHSKTDTVHTLTNGSGGDNIKFIAAADFEAGDSLLVNGTAVAVLDSDGNTAGGAFRSGDTVVMLRNGGEVRVVAPLGNYAKHDDLEAILNDWATGDKIPQNVTSPNANYNHCFYSYNKTTKMLSISFCAYGSAIAGGVPLVSLADVEGIVFPQSVRTFVTMGLSSAGTPLSVALAINTNWEILGPSAGGVAAIFLTTCLYIGDWGNL